MMKTAIERLRQGRSRRRGGALVIALILAVSMAGMCAALLAVNLSTERSRGESVHTQSSFYAAEAGLSDAYMRLTEDRITVTPGTTTWVGVPGAGIKLGSGSYWVALNGDSRSVSLDSTGEVGSNQTRLELVLTAAATGFFQFAAFGAEGVVLDSNAFIDSYDSAYGTYASQVTGGNAFARENGDIGSNADILVKANTEIHGDAKPGPGHIVDDSAPNTFISGSTDPSEDLFVLPPIVVPPVPSSGTLVGTANVTLGPGDIHYDSILMQGGTSLTIVGPARIVADDFTMKSNSNVIFDASGGEIELYSTRDFVLESNSTATTLSNSALDVTLFLDGDNLTKKPADRLELGANADFIGAIYAPHAEFSLASNFNVFGSIMCGKLDLSSFGEIHFDEALLYDGYGATGEMEVTFWTPLAKP